MPCNKCVITTITWCITCSTILLHASHALLHAHTMQHHPITCSITCQLHDQLHAITCSTIPLHVPLHGNYMINYMIHYILNYLPLHALHGMKFPQHAITCFLCSLPRPRSPPPSSITLIFSIISLVFILIPMISGWRLPVDWGRGCQTHILVLI